MVYNLLSYTVAPYVGAWIEICEATRYPDSSVVAPYVGAWIEIWWSCTCWIIWWSLPMWERGLKWLKRSVTRLQTMVAPYVGAWIEIVYLVIMQVHVTVAPYVGPWIEIDLKIL